MGDGVLSYFGYPKADEHDAERAVRAGLDIIAAVGRLNVHPVSDMLFRIHLFVHLVFSPTPK